MTIKPLYQIAKDRNEFGLYLADPALYAAMVAEDEGSAGIWISCVEGAEPVVGTLVGDHFVPLPDTPAAETPQVHIVWEPGLPGALSPEDFASLPWMDADDGSTLELLPPTGPGAVVGRQAVTTQPPQRFDLTSLDEPPLSLRAVVEMLGYEVTPEMDAILVDNPDGPWTLDDLDVLFAADAQGDHPHGVEFQIVGGDA